MDERDRPADLRVLERTEPAALRRGILRDPGADRLDHEDVGEAGDDRFPARAQLTRFGGHEAQRSLEPVRLGRAPRLDLDPARTRRDQVEHQAVPQRRQLEPPGGR